mmetsp:Transcript_26997/g.56805  ORF Transcript_26997/g.56805 Transcript_26997/m.56805 type:complete len:109 (+) Transcript_26997:227-553(+)
MSNHKRHSVIAIVIMMIFCLFPIAVWKLAVCQAEEIVATSKWQIIKEGDTLPAGLHIKVDLSTGEKWAKLVEGNDAPGGGASTSVEVRSDGEVNEVKKYSVSETLRRD